MKHNQLNLDQPVELSLNLPFQSQPFIVTGQTDAVLDLADMYKGQETQSTTPIAKAAPTAPTTATEQVTPHYESLLDMSSRDVSRLALKAWMYDVKSFGRTSMYSLFKAKLQEERDTQQMVDLHIVEAVHCRLHEKMLDKARGIAVQ